jgi:hypothetical protein
MILGRLRVAARIILIGMYIQTEFKFFAAKGDTIIASMNPITVETNAIFNVSNIPIYAFEQKNPKLAVHSGYFLASSMLHSGGHNDSFQNLDKLDKLFEKNVQSP